MHLCVQIDRQLQLEEVLSRLFCPASSRCSQALTAVQGWTALHYATLEALNAACVELLVAKGADVNAKTNEVGGSAQLSDGFCAQGGMDIKPCEHP